MRLKVQHPPLVEHEGVYYAYYDARVQHDEIAELAYDGQQQRVVMSATILEGVRWRSDQGWTDPHDVEIEGEYTIHDPGVP